jgi:predicted glycosyltransferase
VVVSMGGYNTMCEILSLSKQAVIVPRVTPRLEQWIRCQRLAELGFVRIVHPDEMTPQRLIDEVVQSLADQTLRPIGAVTFDGLDQASAIVRADCAVNRI